MWRHAPTHLPPHWKLFIPDLPGYGASHQTDFTPRAFSKLQMGRSILAALKTHLSLPDAPTSTSQKVVLIGHDRGARVSHRLLVHPPNEFTVLGAVILDILPLLAQFAGMAEPRAAAGMFHWTFLAQPFAAEMIRAWGVEGWVGGCFARWAGEGEGVCVGVEAERVYAEAFRKGALEGGCADYKAAIEVDAVEEAAERERGVKVRKEVIVVYGEAFLGQRGDVGSWREWVEEERLVLRGLEGGHWMVEKRGEEVYGIVREWVGEKLGIQ